VLVDSSDMARILAQGQRQNAQESFDFTGKV